MVHAKSCCCGCSLRIGTLIIVLLTVVLDANFVYFHLGLAKGVAGNTLIGSMILRVAVAVIALYGTSRKKPSYLLPFIGVSILNIVLHIFLFFLFVVTSSVIIDSGIFEAIATLMEERTRGNSSLSDVRDNVETDKEIVTSIVYTLEIVVVLSLALHSYFTMVVYNYYKQLVDEAGEMSNTGGVIHSAPVKQGTMSGGHYPHIEPVHPPPYDQQCDEVYSPGYSEKMAVKDKLSLLSHVG